MLMSTASTGLKFGVLALARLARTIIGFSIACGVLGVVVRSADPPTAEVTIHVVDRDVVLSVDDWSERIVGVAPAPIVRHLTTGPHVLTLSRDGVDLHTEEFTVEAGQFYVMTAWIPRDVPGGESPPEAPPGSLGRVSPDPAERAGLTAPPGVPARPGPVECATEADVRARCHPAGTVR